MNAHPCPFCKKQVDPDDSKAYEEHLHSGECLEIKTKAKRISDRTEGYEDGFELRYERGRSKFYQIGWKKGRWHYLTGQDEGWECLSLPVIKPDGLYHVQVGYKSGRYKDRWTFESQLQAVRYYDGLNIWNGYKKRLIAPDGTVQERYIS